MGEPKCENDESVLQMLNIVAVIVIDSLFEEKVCQALSCTEFKLTLSTFKYWFFQLRKQIRFLKVTYTILK